MLHISIRLKSRLSDHRIAPLGLMWSTDPRIEPEREVQYTNFLHKSTGGWDLWILSTRPSILRNIWSGNFGQNKCLHEMERIYLLESICRKDFTSMDRLLMKCACGCLKNVMFLSKTAHLIPIIQQKETYILNIRTGWKCRCNKKDKNKITNAFKAQWSRDN